jgi:hypothetical protein
MARRRTAQPELADMTRGHVARRGVATQCAKRQHAAGRGDAAAVEATRLDST